MKIETKKIIKLEKDETSILLQALYVCADLEDLCEYSSHTEMAKKLRVVEDVLQELLS